MPRTISILILLAYLCSACQEQNTSNQEAKEANTPKIKTAKTPVTIAECQASTFVLKKYINGKLKANRKADLSFESSGQLTSLNVDNGSYIRRGSTLGQIEHGDLQHSLAKNKVLLDKANFEKNKWIIQDGGDADDDSSIPQRKLQTIHTITGVDEAQVNIEATKYQLNKKHIRAPFSGYITDLEVNAYEIVSPGQSFCTLIDPNSFEAIFKVIESDAIDLSHGQPISLYPINNPDKTVKGTVHNINPIVNEFGLVEVRAKIQKHEYRFIEGMNIKVSLDKIVKNQITIPKSALVLRSGKPVVFTYDPKESRSKWNYVSIAHENDHSLAISDGLDKGDLVIIEGNLNLDHDAKVLITNPDSSNALADLQTRVGATIQTKINAPTHHKKYEYTRITKLSSLITHIKNRKDLNQEEILNINNVSSLDQLKAGSIIRLKAI